MSQLTQLKSSSENVVWGGTASALTAMVVHGNLYVAVPAFITSIAASFLDSVLTPWIAQAYPAAIEPSAAQSLIQPNEGAKFAYNFAKIFVVTWITAEVISPAFNSFLGTAHSINVMATVIMSLVANYFTGAIAKNETRAYWLAPANFLALASVRWAELEASTACPPPQQ